MAIRFTVLGIPQPAGSKTGFPIRRKNGSMGVAMSDANKKSKPWQAIVTFAAQLAYRGELLQGPLAVEFTFYMPRLKGHYGKKGLKPGAPNAPTSRPDVLKLARGVEDALTGVVWRDDSQIVEERLVKLYGEPARCEVVIEQIGEQP